MPADTTVRAEVQVGSRVGLHARPAALIAQAAAQQPTVVRIAADGRDPVDARSLLSLLSLGSKQGDTVVLSAEGEGAQAAVDAMAALIARDLDEGA